MKIISIHLKGRSPIVSDFLNKFDDRDVLIDVVKDNSNKEEEDYVVEVKYNEAKLKDPIDLIKKSLPDQVSFELNKSHSDYSLYTDELDELRKSVPNITTYDYYINIAEVLGEDVLKALDKVNAYKFNTSSSLLTAYVELMRKMLSGEPRYDSFTPKNRRDVSDLYIRACNETSKSCEKKALTIYKIAFDAIYDSVQKSKIILSTKSQSKFGLDLSRLISQREFNDNDVELRSYISKKLNSRVADIDSGTYKLSQRLEEFQHSKKFIDEVVKVLDGVSSNSHEQVTTWYLDALRESAKISKPIEEYVDISWDAYKSYLNAKDQS